ncbi:MAG: hypothetical protein AAFR21_08670 [Pseudomonadota bacterium]
MTKSAWAPFGITTGIFCTVGNFLAGAFTAAEARPVSYQGGWTVIEETDRQSTSLWVHYTVTPKLSLGWRTEWDRGQDFVLNGPQATYLAKRWFGENYQANIYLFAGAGAVTGVDTNEGGTNAAGFVGVLADWETRRLFASYRARALEGGDVDASVMQAARLGFAPYEGDTGDLHTWLMVEVDHRPDNPDPVGVTSLVRFFKDAALLELGWSVTDNQPLANFTYRF